MKPIFNISIKTLLFVIIALLILNAFIMISGGLYVLTSSSNLPVVYKTNKLTGETTLIRPYTGENGGIAGGLEYKITSQELSARENPFTKYLNRPQQEKEKDK